MYVIAQWGYMVLPASFIVKVDMKEGSSGQGFPVPNCIGPCHLKGCH